MTHIQPDIRATSTSLLATLVDLSPQPLVKSYFAKSGFIYTSKKIFLCKSIEFSKKRLSKKTIEVDESSAAVSATEIDFDELRRKMQGVVDRFGKVANEAKLGKSNPQIFDNLIINTADGEFPFTSTAQTAVKGRNFMITVFDPSNTKHIVSAILASN
ncbi:ribosome-recycling factor [Candidozyma auris]